MFEKFSERMLPRSVSFSVFFLFLMICLFSCEQEYTPKPMAYPRLELPQKAYENYPNPDCPFSFKKPVYARLIIALMFLSNRKMIVVGWIWTLIP